MLLVIGSMNIGGFTALLPGIDQGNPRAIAEFLRLQAGRAKRLGLDDAVQAKLRRAYMNAYMRWYRTERPRAKSHMTPEGKAALIEWQGRQDPQAWRAQRAAYMREYRARKKARS